MPPAATTSRGIAAHRPCRCCSLSCSLRGCSTSARQPVPRRCRSRSRRSSGATRSPGPSARRIQSIPSSRFSCAVRLRRMSPLRDIAGGADVLAVAVFAAAALTLESGLLVLVIFAAGYLLGLPGVSRRGIIVLLACLGAYLWVRLHNHVGRHAVAAGSRGRIRLCSLPRRGVDADVRRQPVAVLCLQRDERDHRRPAGGAEGRGLALHPRGGGGGASGFRFLLLGVVSSGVSSALIGAYAWSRRAAWAARTFTRGDCLVLMFLAVLGANAAISYAYTKDVIMSPAGFFFAAALCVAVRDRLERLPARSWLAAVPAALVLLVISVTWSVRAVGLHAALVQTSSEVREEWAYADQYLIGIGYVPPPPRVEALKQQLQDDALERHAGGAVLRDEWARWFETD